MTRKTKEITTVNDNQLSVFDYSVLETRIAKLAKESAIEIKAREKAIWENIIEIGNRLIEVKNALPHGQFESWIKLEFQWSDRTAQRYMKISQEIKPKATDMSVLPDSMTALYQLASALGNADEETKEEILTAVEEKTEEKGKALTEKEIKELTKPYLEQIEQLKQKEQQLTLKVENHETRVDNIKTHYLTILDKREKELDDTKNILITKNQELVELQQFKTQLELDKENLDKKIKAEASVIVQNELEKERKVLAKKEADLIAKQGEIEEQLKEAKSIKNKATKEKDNLTNITDWIVSLNDFNEVLRQQKDHVMATLRKVQDLPDLAVLGEVDREIVNKKIDSVIHDFNENTETYGKCLNKVHMCLRKFDNTLHIAHGQTINVEVNNDK